MASADTLSDPADRAGDVRGRIVAAAARLLAEGGRDALTTRAVAAAAGVQAPTLYRLFGDKRGLLDVVAEQGFAAYVAGKATAPSAADPLEAYRQAWDRHVAFGLAHPALFGLMAGDPQPGRVPPAVEAGLAGLRGRVRALAAAGLLRVTETRAVDLTHAAGTGVVLTLLEAAPEARDDGLSAALREAVIAAIVRTAPVAETPGPAGAAIALRASLEEATALTAGERRLLREWLDRIAAAASPSA